MMKRLRKSASPASTWFGGIVGVPRALRVRDRTTMTLVNAVHSTSRAGAIDSTVSSRMMLTVWLGLPTPGSRSTETLPGLFTAPEGPGAGLTAELGRGAGVGLGAAGAMAVTAGMKLGAAGADRAMAAREACAVPDSCAFPDRDVVMAAGAEAGAGAAWATAPLPTTRANSGESSRAGTARRTRSATTGRPLAQRLDERADGWPDRPGSRRVLRDAVGVVRQESREDALRDVLRAVLRQLLRLVLQLAQDGHRGLGDADEQPAASGADDGQARATAQAVAGQHLDVGQRLSAAREGPPPTPAPPAAGSGARPGHQQEQDDGQRHD